MTNVITLARRRAAATTPSTGTPDPIQAYADAHNALAMALHYLRTPSGNLPGATRTRLRIAEANLAELREAKTRRELINLAVVERQLASTFTALRDALLQLPDRLAPGLVAETDAHVIHGILDSEIRQTLHDLANATERMKNDEGAFQ